MITFLLILYIFCAVVNVYSVYLDACHDRWEHGYLSRYELFEYAAQGLAFGFIPLLNFIAMMCWGFPTAWQHLCNTKWMREKMFSKD